MKVFSYNKVPGMLWIRLFGYGVSIKDTKEHPLRFSQRYGYTKYLMIGKYCVEWLKPFKF